MNNYKDILLTNEDYIKTYSSISDNLAGDFLLPSLYIAQHQYLEEIIGSELVKKLQMLVAENRINNVGNEYYRELLDDYIQDYLTFATIGEVIVATSFKVNNFGASRTEDEKQYGISYSEVFKLKDYYKGKADYLAYRMQRYLIANFNQFPELVTYKSIEDLQANLYSAASIPIFLGGARNPKGAKEPSLKDIYNFPSNTKKKQ